MNGEETIYVCMNNDCSYPWMAEKLFEARDSDDCPDCAMPLSKALVEIARPKGHSSYTEAAAERLGEAESSRTKAIDNLHAHSPKSLVATIDSLGSLELSVSQLLTAVERLERAEES